MVEAEGSAQSDEEQGLLDDSSEVWISWSWMGPTTGGSTGGPMGRLPQKDNRENCFQMLFPLLLDLIYKKGVILNL